MKFRLSDENLLSSQSSKGIRGSRFYKFTSKSQSGKGIMSTVLGLIAMISFVVVIIRSFSLAGHVGARFGATGLLSVVFSLTGLILGLISLGEKDKFPWLCYAGTIINIIDCILWGAIILLGVGSIKL